MPGTCGRSVCCGEGGLVKADIQRPSPRRLWIGGGAEAAVLEVAVDSFLMMRRGVHGSRGLVVEHVGGVVRGEA